MIIVITNHDNTDHDNDHKHIIPGSGDHVGWSPRFNNNDNNTHNVVLTITIKLIVIVIVT